MKSKGSPAPGCLQKIALQEVSVRLPSKAPDFLLTSIPSSSALAPPQEVPSRLQLCFGSSLLHGSGLLASTAPAPPREVPSWLQLHLGRSRPGSSSASDSPPCSRLQLQHEYPRLHAPGAVSAPTPQLPATSPSPETPWKAPHVGVGPLRRRRPSRLDLSPRVGLGPPTSASASHSREGRSTKETVTAWPPTVLSSRHSPVTFSLSSQSFKQPIPLSPSDKHHEGGEWGEKGEANDSTLAPGATAFLCVIGLNY